MVDVHGKRPINDVPRFWSGDTCKCGCGKTVSDWYARLRPILLEMQEQGIALQDAVEGIVIPSSSTTIKDITQYYTTVVGGTPAIGTNIATPTVVGTINPSETFANGDLVSLKGVVTVELLVGSIGDFSYVEIYNTTDGQLISAGSAMHYAVGSLHTITIAADVVVAAAGLIQPGSGKSFDIRVDGTLGSQFQTAATWANNTFSCLVVDKT